MHRGIPILTSWGLSSRPGSIRNNRFSCCRGSPRHLFSGGAGTREGPSDLAARAFREAGVNELFEGHLLIENSGLDHPIDNEFEVGLVGGRAEYRGRGPEDSSAPSAITRCPADSNCGRQTRRRPQERLWRGEILPQHTLGEIAYFFSLNPAGIVRSASVTSPETFSSSVVEVIKVLRPGVEFAALDS
jgi:hypothetical protein